METVLQTFELTKAYKTHKAVDSVNLTVRKGDIYGFLGQNGAGKTTTIRMIMGLIKPTAGEVELFGKKVTAKDTDHLERIGTIIEFPGFYPNLSVGENLEIHRYLMGMPDRKVVDESLELVGLQNVKTRKFSKLSLGMKQRLGIARALLHKPELLILDEPTNGLDPAGIKEIRRLILDLAETRHNTIMVSSHILSEVQLLAKRIGIIHQGRLVKEVDIEDIDKFNQHYLELKVKNDRKAVYVLEQKCNIKRYRMVDQGVIRIYEQLEESALLNRMLVQDGVEVSEISLRKDSLEDYFLNITGGTTDG
ncbi:ABC transporter ATP-binding protein [Paenibacillus sp. GCM10027626]|uniref:ABC transporter ATP-binding protein n=1 Tax=Paenibacillus sp. GCM10027626 TaxID=3273411 RepID=UPI0036321E1C